jgi:hypothetical protein
VAGPVLGLMLAAATILAIAALVLFNSVGAI